MSRRHTSPNTGTAMSFLAAGTSFFTLLAWDGLSDDSSAFLVPLFWVCLVIAAVGLGLRLLHTPAAVVVLAQLVTVALLVHQQWSVGGALGGLIPTPSSVQAIGALMSGAVDATVQYAAPIPADATDFAALMLGCGAGVALLVDFFACTVRRVPLAGLPLLAVFTAPVSLLGGVSWVVFALAALCFVLLLATAQASRLGSWGRSLTGPVNDSEPHTVGLGAVWPTATRLGVAGIAVAVVAPVLLPTTDGLLGGEGGIGPGSGNDEVNISNPMIDVQQDLLRGPDVPLLRAVTTDPDPRYLRISVLDEFDGTSWLPSDRNIPVTNRVEGPMPEPPGLEPRTDRTQHEWSISVTEELTSIWLPVPYPATQVRVEGDWRYDSRTLDLVTPAKGTSTAGLSYSAAGLELRTDPADLVAAPPPDRNVATPGTQLPESVPDWLEELAREVTEGGRSSFERAVQLQQWFREDGGFTYSLERATAGNSIETLERFLGTGEGSRTGYCEQFAAAMALMARTLDIPARVAVGFLRPERSGDAWLYSAHDLHAWPELYFEGAGWIRFEPTPAAEDVAAPAYTAGRVPAPEELETPTVSPTVEEPTMAPDQERIDEPTSSESAGSSVVSWLGRTALVVALLGLLAAPRGVRAMLRRRRLSGEAPGGPAEGAWAEVRATALDLGLAWDDGVTLRRRARALAPMLAPTGHDAGDPQPAGDWSPIEALERLVLLLERSRFSRDGLPATSNAEPAALASTVTGALRRAAKPATQRRATWLPASLWRGEGLGGTRQAGGMEDRISELDRVSV